jgi:hypothetical protein
MVNVEPDEIILPKKLTSTEVIAEVERHKPTQAEAPIVVMADCIKAVLFVEVFE